MLYLILAILASMSVSVCMRFSEKYRKNKISMLSVNYVIATILSVISARGQSVMPNRMTLLLGIITGAVYLVSFVLLQWNVNRNGVALTSTFMKLGLLVPITMSVLFFGEKPTVLQISGFVLSLGAIILMQTECGGGKCASIGALIGLLLAGGLADGMSKVFEQLGSSNQNGAYLLITFASAMVFSAILALCKGQRLAPADILWGSIIAIPNYFSAHLLLLALGQLPAVVTYPTYSIAGIIAISSFGVLVFHERLSRRQVIAFGIILVAILLLNL